MKFQISASGLLKAMNVVIRSISSRVQLPILSNVLIEASEGSVLFLGTDLEMSFAAKEGAKVEVPGKVAIPAKVFLEFLTTIETGVVELELVGEVLHVRSEKVKTKMTTMSADEFPVIPEFGDKFDWTMDVSTLVKGVNQTSISASRDDSRPVYTGILWRKTDRGILMASTDGYRLSLMDVDKVIDNDVLSVVVPVRSLLEFTRVVGKENGDVEIRVDTNSSQMCFRFGGVTMITRLLGGEFPNFEQILPKESIVKVTVSKSELAAGVKRALIFAKDSANTVRFDIEQDQLRVSAKSVQLGDSESSVSAEVNGENLAVAFNGRYVVDFLNSIEGDKVYFESEGSLKPGLFRTDQAGYLHVIMPLRITE